MKTMRFLDYQIYRYFIGRPNQSMSQESLIRNAPQHERVLQFIVDYYVETKDRCVDTQREYMALMFYFMYYSHIDIVCQKFKKRFKAYRMIKKFDKNLKKKAPDLYKKVSAFPYLRWSRRLGYLNVWLFNKPFTKLVDLGRRLRAR